jgi:hypothetical protein
LWGFIDSVCFRFGAVLAKEDSFIYVSPSPSAPVHLLLLIWVEVSWEAFHCDSLVLCIQLICFQQVITHRIHWCSLKTCMINAVYILASKWFSSQQCI